MENITNNAETYVNNENEVKEFLNKPVIDLQPVKETKEEKKARLEREKTDRLAKIESDKLLARISLLTSFIVDLKESGLSGYAKNLESLNKHDFETALNLACDLVGVNETGFNRIAWQSWILRVNVTKNVKSLENVITKSDSGNFDLMNDFHPLQRRDLRITFKGHELLTTVLNCFDKRKKCQITDDQFNNLPKCITDKQLARYFVRVESK